MKKDVIVIIGPTASGKSSVGIELAKRIDGIVISADSMQIYKKLDVGTAKVTKEEADGIVHELIDIVDIDTKFSVSDYKKMCYEKIDEVISKGKVPIIVGGTGLYINAVVNNMSFEEFDKDFEAEVNDKINSLKEEKKPEELYEFLKEIDIDAANKIEKENTKRVLRAIKMSLLGVNKSEVEKRDDLWHKNESPYNFLVFYMDMPRSLLYDRINKRVDKMVDKGVLEEVRYVYEASKKDITITSLQAIGYKEFFDYIEDKKSLEECKELLKQKTRNYAKRQITWFKKLENKIILDGTKESIVEDIVKEYYGKQ